MKKGYSLAHGLGTRRLAQYGACLLLLQLVMACSPAAPDNNAAAPVQNRAEVPAPRADGKLVVAFGDSLYAGYSLGPEEGFAPALERALAKTGVTASVFNAGVSGDTSTAGLARLGFVLDGLPRKPDLVIVGLGGNDMLRGLDAKTTRANLDAILAALKKRGIPAMLTGMVASPNMGPDYAAAFNPLYADLARTYDVLLYPFFLDGVIGHRDLLLSDGIHPNPKGVETIVAKVSPLVAQRLKARNDDAR